MKTLFFIFYDLDIGGIQQKIIDMTRYIHENRHGIKTIIILKDKPKYTNRENELKPYGSVVHNYHTSFLSKFKFCFPLYTLYLGWKYRPVAIFSFSLIPSICSVLIKTLINKQIRSVIDIDGSPFEYELSLSYASMRRELMKYFYPKADALIAVNTSIQKELTDITGMKIRDITILPNWKYSIHKKKTHKCIACAYDLVYVGRLEKIKQVQTLLDMTHILKNTFPHIRLCIVGDGSEKNSLIRRAKKLHISSHISWIGYSNNPGYYIDRSKIFIFPSKNEGMSFALLDAMSRNKAVVCNNFPSCNEVIENGVNGYIYKSIEKACTIIEKILSSHRLMHQLGVQAQKTVEKKYSKKTIERYLSLLHI